MARTRGGASTTDNDQLPSTPEAVTDECTRVLRKRKAVDSPGEKKETPTEKSEPAMKKCCEERLKKEEEIKEFERIKREKEEREDKKKIAELRAEVIAKISTMTEEQGRLYIKERLSKMDKANNALKKKYDAADKRLERLSEYIDARRAEVEELKEKQEQAEADINERQERIKKNDEDHKKMHADDVKQGDRINELEKREKELSLLVRSKLMNNTSLLSEASRLKEDNVRLKNNMRNAIYCTTIALVNGQI